MRKLQVAALVTFGLLSFVLICALVYLNHKFKPERIRQRDVRKITKITRIAIERYDKKDYRGSLEHFKLALQLAEQYDNSTKFTKQLSFGDMKAVFLFWCTLNSSYLKDENAALQYLLTIDSKGLMPNLFRLKIYFWHYPLLNNLLSYKRYRSLLAKYLR
jgi:hypothetical protein